MKTPPPINIITEGIIMLRCFIHAASIGILHMSDQKTSADMVASYASVNAWVISHAVAFAA